MNYGETLNIIDEKTKNLGITPGLDNIRELLKRLGNPQDKVPAIHIAGTNGKGSIMAYVEEVLILSGLKVGRYISPAIFDYRERWKINKKEVTENDVAETLTDILKAIDEMARDGFTSPSAFEIETAAAFYMFEKNQCDVMLIECGMGGRLDATNVMKNKIVDVLASVSLDHMEYLGNTIGEITKEKLGIINEGDTLVTYPTTEEVNEAIFKYIIDHEFFWRKTEINALDIIKSNVEGSEFYYRGTRFSISMAGEYQIYNAICAVEVIHAYNRYAIKNGKDAVQYDIIRKGLSQTSWPGRFSVIHRGPYIIADGAHNKDAWRVLAESIEKYFPSKKVVFILGVFKDKQYDDMIRILSPFMKCCFTVTAPGSRGLDAEYLATKMCYEGCRAVSCKTIREALAKAKEAAGKNGVVVATGSLSYIGRLIEISYEIDND